jgi:carboxyl-terminal processing protease
MLVMTKRAAAPLVLVALLSFLAGRAVRNHWGGGQPSAGTLFAKLTPGYVGQSTDLAPLDVFAAVLDALERDYVDRITDKKKLTYGALENMVNSLNDPYSQFMTPQQRQAMEEAEGGTFHGLGAVMVLKPAQHNGIKHFRLALGATVPGSAARKAGLRPGDVITRIDDGYFFQLPIEVQQDIPDRDTLGGIIPLPDKSDKPLRFISYKDAMDTLGEDGKKIKLAVQREGSSQLVEVDLELEKVQVPAVESRMLSANVGYVQINGFTKGCKTLLRESLADLKKQGATSLVLDLRDNFGGPLDEMQAAAGELIQGTLGYIQRRGAEKKTLVASTDGSAFRGQIAVLVNEATMGSAELLAAAFRERRLAPLIGSATFGDGLNQTLFPLADGSAVKLTTGKLLTANGKDFNGKGIAPNMQIAAADKQLSKAVEVLTSTPQT